MVRFWIAFKGIMTGFSDGLNVGYERKWKSRRKQVKERSREDFNIL